MAPFSNTGSGTRFIVKRPDLETRMSEIKAVLFDWDGVFNDGTKDIDGGSPFSEVGSMGVNLLRFALWLKNGELPKAAVITGQHNPFAEKFGRREKLHGVYMGFTNKPEAFDAFLSEHGLKPQEVAFVFDDVLDLPVATRCGVRVMIGSTATGWLVNKVIGRGDCDIVTVCDGGRNGLREATDTMIDLLGNGLAVLEHRVEYTGTYLAYLAARQAVEPKIARNPR